MIRFAPSETSFRGAADYIVSEALTSEEEKKHKFVIALKCMLLIKKINKDSLDVIAAALKKLAGINENEVKYLREAAIDGDMKPVTLRGKIAALVERLDDSIDVQHDASADG